MNFLLIIGLVLGIVAGGFLREWIFKPDPEMRTCKFQLTPQRHRERRGSAFFLCGLCASVAISLFFCGCSKTQPNTPVFQVGHLEWNYPEDFRDTGKKENTLMIVGVGISILTNVTSLDDAANILGSYGWELAAVDRQKNQLTYYLRSQSTNRLSFVIIHQF